MDTSKKKVAVTIPEDTVVEIKPAPAGEEVTVERPANVSTPQANSPNTPLKTHEEVLEKSKEYEKLSKKHQASNSPNNHQIPASKSPEQEGIDTGRMEVIKEDVKSEIKSKIRLDALVKTGSVELMRIRAFWPFDFFPNEVIIDKNKVSIVRKTFFWSEQIRSALYKDITNVILETSLFFATIMIVERGYVEQTYIVKYLKKKEALEAMHLIQGLCTVVQQGKVNVQNIDKEELKMKAIEIGTARGE